MEKAVFPSLILLLFSPKGVFGSETQIRNDWFSFVFNILESNNNFWLQEKVSPGMQKSNYKPYIVE